MGLYLKLGNALKLTEKIKVSPGSLILSSVKYITKGCHSYFNTSLAYFIPALLILMNVLSLLMLKKPLIELSLSVSSSTDFVLEQILWFVFLSGTEV